MRYLIVLALAATLGACNEKTTPPPAVSASAYTIAYSPGMPATMKDNKDGTYSFDFPKVDGIHYVYKKAPALKQGQIIMITYAIEGDGTIVPTEGDPPARIRLFIQQAGDDLSAKGDMEFARWWSIAAPELKIGSGILSANLAPAEWSSVLGKRGDAVPNKFTGVLPTIANIGFTFGGVFAGHGDFVKNGTAKFTLKSFAVK